MILKQEVWDRIRPKFSAVEVEQLMQVAVNVSIAQAVDINLELLDLPLKTKFTGLVQSAPLARKGVGR